MDPTDPAWPTGPALHLYDIETDSYRPCTQRELDRLAAIAWGAGAAFATLSGALHPEADHDG